MQFDKSSRREGVYLFREKKEETRYTILRLDRLISPAGCNFVNTLIDNPVAGTRRHWLANCAHPPTPPAPHTGRRAAIRPRRLDLVVPRRRGLRLTPVPGRRRLVASGWASVVWAALVRSSPAWGVISHASHLLPQGALVESETWPSTFCAYARASAAKTLLSAVLGSVGAGQGLSAIALVLLSSGFFSPCLCPSPCFGWARRSHPCIPLNHSCPILAWPSPSRFTPCTQWRLLRLVRRCWHLAARRRLRRCWDVPSARPPPSPPCGGRLGNMAPLLRARGRWARPCRQRRSQRARAVA